MKYTIDINFIDGAYCYINDNLNENIEYEVKFINKKTNVVEFSNTINSNCWLRTFKKYYIDWRIEIYTNNTLIYEYDINLNDKTVYIIIDAEEVGDTLAWIPYVEEFRKKHNCKVICSTYLNDLIKETYTNIKFVQPNEYHDSYATYIIGWHKNKDNSVNYNNMPCDFKKYPLQKASADILGLEYTEIKPKIKLHDNIQKKNIVSIAIHSTAQAKYWNNPTGWQDVVNYLNKKNYEVVLLSIEDSGYCGNIHPIGIRQLPKLGIDNVIKTLQESKLFIGGSSGLSWLSWAAGTPTILISGVSDVYTEMTSNIVRIRTPENKCFACSNTHPFDRNDWNWCPEHKGTDRQFECSISITSEMVINSIKTILN